MRDRERERERERQTEIDRDGRQTTATDDGDLRGQETKTNQWLTDAAGGQGLRDEASNHWAVYKLYMAI